MNMRPALPILVLALVTAAGGPVLCAGSGTPLQYQYKILHAFPYDVPYDGSSPYGGLVLDVRGNLYGVANGGQDVDGVVFELMPGVNGQWSETVVHNFAGSPSDGNSPGGIAIDSSGNLFGTTTFGGNGNCFAPGCGTVWELTPNGNGQWAESIIWNVCPPSDCHDQGGLDYGPAVDSAGNVYGLAYDAFKMTLGQGGWTYTSLYALTATAQSPPTLDAKGNIYFEPTGYAMGLHPQRNGQWGDYVLFSFGQQSDGLDPQGGVTLHGGAVYGTTELGGDGNCFGGCGTVFELTHTGKTVSERVLWNFGEGSSQGGILPVGGVVADSHGDLFGVTNIGGASCGCGVVYGLRKKSDGTWAFAVLHQFQITDGFAPSAPLIIDAQGNLYGETVNGGPNGGGVVFELSPVR